MMNGTPRVLIVRLSAIGDVVRVLPALQAIRDAHPYAQIDWAVERKAAAIVLDHPALDQIHIFERPEGRWAAFRSFLRFALKIRAARYEIVLDYHGIFKSGLIARLSGAGKRFGFARPRSQELSWLAYTARVALPSEVINRVEENLILTEQVAPWPKHIGASIAVDPDTQEHIEGFIGDTFGDGKLVVAMHVPVDREEKQWPLEYFAALSDLLIGDGRFHVMLTWGPGQFEMIERVTRHCRRKPVIAPETPDLKHYAWLVHHADLYFGGDTGPMHIAAAMGTPVIAIFGGTDPQRHAPYKHPHAILTPPEDAANDPAAITPDEAYDACIQFVAEHGMRPRHEPETHF